ncbi:MAG: NAD/NADP octopine/nopaline dehydrogenase family protein, partial [Nocardioides sp.]|nr:NAD/NADP octopine/nopaline dehydrogenase family protein [Nocardioides sp.]
YFDGTRTDIALTPSIEGAAIHACVIVSESRTLPALVTAHREIFAGLPVLLAPGGLAGALRVSAVDESLLVAETTGFPASGFTEGDTFFLRGVKHGMPFAAVDHQLAPALLAEFRRYLPTLVASDLRTTSLSNTNHIIHPPITLMNAARIDSATPFTLYREGVSSSLEHLLRAVDEERRSVCRAVGADDRSGRDWLYEFYHRDGMEGATFVDCLTSYPGFADVHGPTTLDYRYLADDVPHGVACWAEIGGRIGIPTPSIDHLLAVLATIAPNVDLRADADGLELFLEHVQQSQQDPVPHH